MHTFTCTHSKYLTSVGLQYEFQYKLTFPSDVCVWMYVCAGGLFVQTVGEQTDGEGEKM